MRSFPLSLLAAVTVLSSSCSKIEPTGAAEEAAAVDPRGTFDVDEETGETSARFKAEDGTVTAMRSGRTVPPDLPEGFTLYPQARAVNVTRVDQGERRSIIVDLRSDATPRQIADHYLAEAEAAGFMVEPRLRSDETEVLAGEDAEGLAFSLVAKREKGATQAQLSMGDTFR
jgi:hypothetical protein